jgi:hypothetical protein
MTLEIAKSADITSHIEPVGGPFHGAPWFVSSIGSVADQRGDDSRSLRLRHGPGHPEQFGIRQL